MTNAADAVLPRLTNRERDVLECLAEGLSNREMALRLGASEGAVSFHLSNLYGKLGTNRRAEAILTARELVAWINASETLEDEDTRPVLGPREADAIRLLAEGIDEYEVARLMGIGKGTVAVYVSVVKQKMGAADRSDVLKRFREGKWKLGKGPRREKAVAPSRRVEDQTPASVPPIVLTKPQPVVEEKTESIQEAPPSHSIPQLKRSEIPDFDPEARGLQRTVNVEHNEERIITAIFHHTSPDFNKYCLCSRMGMGVRELEDKGLVFLALAKLREILRIYDGGYSLNRKAANIAREIRRRFPGESVDSLVKTYYGATGDAVEKELPSRPSKARG